MGAIMRAHDWTATPLGRPESWPQSLRTTVRLALNTRHPVFIFWGPDLLCFYNDAYSRTIGPERHPRAVGRPAREVWDEIWHIIGPQIEQVLAGDGATWHEEHLVPITRHGRREDVWWTYSYSPIDDDSAPGGVGGVLVLCNDVTERHLARKTIHESETRLRAVFDSGLLGLTIFDAVTGQTLAINDRALELVDCTRDEFETGARGWRDATAPEHLERDERAVRQFLETGRADPFEKEYVRKDGKRVPVRLSLAALPGQPGRVVVGVEDLSLRQAAERALGESEQRVQLALDAAHLGSWDLDLLSDQAVCSPRHSQIFGYDERQTCWGRAVAERHVIEEDRPAFHAAYESALETGAFCCELRVRWPDGSVHWVASRGRTHYDVSGRPVRMSGVVGDVTERKAAETRLAALADFGDRIRELRDPLEIAHAAAVAIGRGLGAARAGYGVVDKAEEILIVERDWTNGQLPSAVGSWRLLDIWPGISEELRRGEAVVVADAQADARIAGAAAEAFASERIRGTIEVPVVEDGRVAAVLYVHDLAPRRWSKEEVAFAMGVAERARTAAKRAQAEQLLRESTMRLSTLLEALPLGVALIDRHGWVLVRNVAMQRFVPEVIPSRDEARRHRWRGDQNNESRIDPSEFPAARALRGETVLPGMEFIYTDDDGSETWTRLSAVPLRDDNGQVAGAVLIVTDISAQKSSDEHQALLAREVDHRAKNALAVVQAALRLTPKGDPNTYARSIEGRVAALARAHTILAAGSWKSAALRQLVEAELAAFQSGSEADTDAAWQQATTSGPDIALAPGSVQSLSMTLHELATNAAKHGALSAPGGRVSVSWEVNPEAGLLVLTWREQGGPRVPSAPTRRGFGSRVIEATVENQLGGAVDRAWDEAGLVCVITVPMARALAIGTATVA